MKLFDGITYMHEHVTIDLSGIKKDLDCRLDTLEDTIEEFKQLKKKGVANILDVTNRGMGRNIEYALKVQEQSGINIIFSTGYYKEPFLPEEVYNFSEEELKMVMVKEIVEGLESTGVKAEVIGEIGTSKDMITPIERKLLISGAKAQEETGKPLSTHTTLGTLGLEQIDILKSNGANLNKVIIGHVDLSGDIDYILKLIDKGVYVAFDTIGKVNYMPEERRLQMLREICNRGLSNRVVMSMDITRKTHLKVRGGLGYSYLLDKFIPFIKENGIAERDIENMLINNAKDIFK
ncbi:TatD family hydrolase [Clostridium swellfunianum]|uniref:phosphotriesterase family protein n=1 Tax=Clostridium swellfunianum TaxID=1367462 RepID=UPI00202F8966|nr:TatD family hydrolase [Clostridium swellfunianum]MCM0649738.1 TatD family hydrolase [Clostridium swellfunianum]